jgi:hypothetical protein
LSVLYWVERERERRKTLNRRGEQRYIYDYEGFTGSARLSF